MKSHSWNRIFVNVIALEENFRLLQEAAGPLSLLAMVKANAYGHGMIRAAKAFARAGCRYFGVAEIYEGVELRKAGIEGLILITIGFTAEDVSLFFEYALTPVICTTAHLNSLEKEAAHRGQNIDFHLKVNTGMGRLGLMPDEVEDFTKEVDKCPHLRITGVMSHFPEADLPGSESTEESLQEFLSITSWLKQKYNVVCHIANSGALFHYPESYCDMIRVGIALYGYHPAGSKDLLKKSRLTAELKPVMRFTSRILQVKEYPEGISVSYGRTFVSLTPLTIAVIPVGYEDGLDRARSNGGVVLVGGKRVPICGRICMNMSMLDVSDLENVQVGDEVVLLGRQQDEVISADDIAAETGTISYEVLCRFGHMNKEFMR